MKIKLIIIVVLFIFKSSAQCFRYINTGNYQVLALKSDNTLWGTGANYNGELGDGTYVARNTMSQIGTDSNWYLISTGGLHTIAIKTDGTLWAWGNNSSGQLGDGTLIQRNSPVQIGNDNDWKYISTKGWTSFAIKNNGTLWGWGQNNISNIGLGYYSLNVTSPTQVGNENTWKYIFAGYDHTVAIKTNNTLWAWGSNQYGKIGIGSFTGNFLSPIQIGTDTDWKSVSTGYHTLAVKNNGTLWAWGNNTSGELGNNTIVNNDLPSQIGTDTDWNIVSATINSSYCIKNNGTLWAWGNNSHNEFGNGTTISSNIPIQINNDTNWQSISPRQAHEVALKTDFSTYIWGTNNFAIPTVSPIPVQLSNSCSLSTQNFILVKDTISVYPNPTSGIVTIEGKSNLKSIQLFDVQGRLLQTKLQNDVNASIDISDKSNGIYFLKITSETGIKVEKIIKK